jgi:hypothetical protein
MKSSPHRYAVNLLTIALIVLAAAVFGSRISRWQRGERERPDPGAAASAVAVSDDPLADARFFPADGGAASLKREAFRGSPQAAQRRLRQLVAAVAEQCRAPSGEASPQEAALIEKLAGENSSGVDVALADGRPGRLHEYQGPMLLTAVIAAADTGDSPQTRNPAGRVVCWGLGMMVGRQSEGSALDWTLAVMPTAAEPTESIVPAFLSLPAEAEFVMTFGTPADGQAVFRGGSPARNRAYFASRGWRQTGDWAEFAQGETAQFVCRNTTVQISLYERDGISGGLLRWRQAETNTNPQRKQGR